VVNGTSGWDDDNVNEDREMSRLFMMIPLLIEQLFLR